MVGVPSAVLGDFPYMQMWMKSLTFRAGWCNVQAYMRPLLDHTVLFSRYSELPSR